MKYLLCIYIIFISVILSGCSVSLRPKPSEQTDLEDGYYYGDSAYRYYYGLPAPSVYDYYEYSSNYNPWTMGTYYENYSSPKRSNATSDTSNSRASVTSENQRPSTKNNDQVTSSQPKAPVNESSLLRRERSVERESIQPSSTNDSNSSAQKTRRDTIRARETQTSKDNKIMQNNTQNTQHEIRKEDNTNSTDDEEKEKQKRRRRSVD